MDIGVCSASLAELWEVYYGLFIAWDKMITKLEVEVDYEVVVGYFKTEISETNLLSFLIRLRYGFLKKDWTVRLTHMYRESNHLVEGLANYAFSRPLGLQLLDPCPKSVYSSCLEDARESSWPRCVRL